MIDCPGPGFHGPFKIDGMNAHAVGIVMKECLRRSVAGIREERRAFEVTKKIGYGGVMDDLFSSADTRAQAVIIKSLRECFPTTHICAEEKPLDAPVPESVDTYFVVDPLDGTKAFVRKQSHGVGSMIALVHMRRIVAAYVADVNTKEIFGYRPESTKVSRITDYDYAEELGLTPREKLFDGYVLLRDPPEKYFEESRNAIMMFKNYIADGGSIGTWMARLWKQEVIAALMPAGMETPWDSNPIYGISEALGYECWRPQREGEGDTSIGRGFVLYTQPPIPSVCKRDYDVLIIHRDHRSTFRAWQSF